MSEREAELKDRQANAAKSVSAHLPTLGSTVDPKVVRDVRDRIYEAVDAAVEAVDGRARILDRPEVET